MATNEEVKKLAALARLSITDTELETLTKELDSILEYIGRLESLSVDTEVVGTIPQLRNVMREDTSPHAPGAYTEELTEQFPERSGNALLVKQIISHD